MIAYIVESSQIGVLAHSVFIYNIGLGDMGTSKKEREKEKDIKKICWRCRIPPCQRYNKVNGHRE